MFRIYCKLAAKNPFLLALKQPKLLYFSKQSKLKKQRMMS